MLYSHFFFIFFKTKTNSKFCFFLKIIGPPRSIFKVGIVALYWHLSFSIMPYNKEWDRQPIYIGQVVIFLIQIAWRFSILTSFPKGRKWGDIDSGPAEYFLINWGQSYLVGLIYPFIWLGLMYVIFDIPFMIESHAKIVKENPGSPTMIYYQLTSIANPYQFHKLWPD